MNELKQSILALITETSSNLPPDVRRAIKAAMAKETPATQSSVALDMIAANIDMACEGAAPICQDTGMPTFEIHTPVGTNQIVMRQSIREAIAEATRLGKLRPNSVDSLTGKNSGDNLGPGTPIIHFEQWENDEIEIKLILKGGGCENKNIQYSLPCSLDHLGRADRTLEGVRKCIMHAVYQAQGHGCSVGALGVSIGGDRTSGYAHAKEQLFRTLDDVNPNPELARLEATIMKDANELGIGTMGFGGQTTLIGCKIGVQNRLPASYFVSVAYDCWAFRRLGVRLNAQTGAIRKWLYKEDDAVITMAREHRIPVSGRRVVLEAPITAEQIASLKVGDIVFLNGLVHTGRDAIHHHLLSHDSPVNLNGAVLYHCGPVALQKDGAWTITAAGPTTSMREEPYQGDIIKKFGIRAVVGKGGMGSKTLAALKANGAVYLNAIGGAAQYYARCITRVTGVDFLEFGIPEAMWHFTVENFPSIVTMDSHGNSLHADIEQSSGKKLEEYATPGSA